MSLYTVPELIQRLESMRLDDPQLADGMVLEEAAEVLARLQAENDRLRKRCDALALLHYGPAHPDPTGKTREPPHCPTCCCGSDVHPLG